MLEFEILTSGVFSSTDVVTTYAPDDARMPISAEVEGYLYHQWELHNRWARNNKLEVRNEEMLRLVDFEVNRSTGELRLDLSLTDYREFSGTRAAGFLNGKNRDELANPLGTSAVVITADNRILCGRRPANSCLNPNRYFVVGGFLTPEDMNIEQGLFAGILREIHEETGIPVSSCSYIRCVGLLYDPINPHPELCFSVKVKEDFETVRRYVSQDDEIVELEYIDNTREGVASWMLRFHPKEVVGTAEGCLLLHGLHAFGRNWFNDTFSKLEVIHE